MDQPVAPPVKKKMAVVPYDNRVVAGHVTGFVYRMTPWAEVDERDIPAMLQIRVTTGCSCNNSYKNWPLFATEEQILTGQVKPIWKGRNGSPA